MSEFDNNTRGKSGAVRKIILALGAIAAIVVAIDQLVIPVKKLYQDVIDGGERQPGFVLQTPKILSPSVGGTTPKSPKRPMPVPSSANTRPKMPVIVPSSSQTKECTAAQMVGMWHCGGGPGVCTPSHDYGQLIDNGDRTYTYIDGAGNRAKFYTNHNTAELVFPTLTYHATISGESCNHMQYGSDHWDDKQLHSQ